MRKYEKYLDLALKEGADSAYPFEIGDVCFDPRTVLKCRFGCEDYGKHYYCPNNPKLADVEQSIRLFGNYKGGIIIRTVDKKEAQRISLAVEREAMRNGNSFALSLSSCALCEVCACGAGGACPHKRDARPAFHTVGVDVVSTVKRLGAAMSESREGKTVYFWFAAVFID